MKNSKFIVDRRMIKKISLGLTIGSMLLMAGCTDDNVQGENQVNNETNKQADDVVQKQKPEKTGKQEVQTEASDDTKERQPSYDIDVEDMFSAEDKEIGYDKANANVVDLSKGSLEISEPGTYIVSGTLSDGQIIINVDDEDVRLVLDNAVISSSSSAPIYVKSADNVFVTLAEGSNNVLEVTGEYKNNGEDNIDGVVFSKSDITFNGNGTLEIKANYGHGIVAKDDVIFTSGTYKITSAAHGISANDSIRIADGTFDITSTKDGMHADNEEFDEGYVYIANGKININSGADSIDASGTLQIDAGEFTLNSGGGFKEVLNIITMGNGKGNTVHATETLEYSMKAMKSNEMVINGGTFNISAYEDAVHANANLTINDGVFEINTGDDALHADYDLVINNITVDIKEGYEGIEGDNVTINGGDIKINVLDDAINVGSSTGLLTIAGGDIYLACKGDGIDSNGAFAMTGGNVVINNTPVYAGGDSNVDVDGEVTFTGGTIKDVDGDDIDPTIKPQRGARPEGMPGDKVRPEGAPGMPGDKVRPDGVPGMTGDKVRPEGIPDMTEDRVRPDGESGIPVDRLRPEGVPGIQDDKLTIALPE